LDELLEVATAVIEVDDRQADAERVIDALVRVAPDDSHPGFGPLKKRLGQLFKRLNGNFFDGCGHYVDLVAMLMVWGKLIAFEDTIVIDREYHRPGPVGLVGFLGIRNREIAEAIGKGQSVQLLGTLTHEEGWVDPEIL